MQIIRIRNASIHQYCGCPYCSAMSKAVTTPVALTIMSQEILARRVLEEIATVGMGIDVPLDEYIKILAEYRRICENRGSYKEAELVNHVLAQLRLEEENRHVSALAQQQENERRGLEEAHMLEFQVQGGRIWDQGQRESALTHYNKSCLMGCCRASEAPQ